MHRDRLVQTTHLPHRLAWAGSAHELGRLFDSRLLQVVRLSRYDRFAREPVLTISRFNLKAATFEPIPDGTAMAVDAYGCVRPAKEGERAIGTVVGTYCANCGEKPEAHGPENKCLFEATTFSQSPEVHIKMTDTGVVASFLHGDPDE